MITSFTMREIDGPDPRTRLVVAVIDARPTRLRWDGKRGTAGDRHRPSAGRALASERLAAFASVSYHKVTVYGSMVPRSFENANALRVTESLTEAFDYAVETWVSRG